MARIAIDMDEVIADALSKHLEQYNSHFGKNLEREDLMGKMLHEYVSREEASKLYEFLVDETFFADLPVMADAIEVLEELSQKHELFITTAAMEFPTSFTAKYEWLRRHFPFISPLNIVFCGDKSVINADYLIDDSARHFKRFIGQGILFDAPHNVNETGYKRVKSWREVRDLFRELDAAASAQGARGALWNVASHQ